MRLTKEGYYDRENVQKKTKQKKIFTEIDHITVRESEEILTVAKALHGSIPNTGALVAVTVQANETAQPLDGRPVLDDGGSAQ